MNILVICIESIADYPPTISLCRDLLDLGHEVTLMSCGCDDLPMQVSRHRAFRIENLKRRPKRLKRVIHDIEIDKRVSKYCAKNASKFDLIWTTTDYSARACGKTLFGHKHVMQLMELAEYVPAFSRHEVPIESKTVIELARRAYRVVVPEENRAFIQQAWWRLPALPSVLPNKSTIKIDGLNRAKYKKIEQQFEGENRKVLLYQGVFSTDRSFSGLIEAMDYLDDGYALYLMGVREPDWKRMDQLRAGRESVVLIPFVPAPHHLLFTDYAKIGLLPYKPSYNRASPLNALYCAPNKIWEYSKFGLPMLGSNVPGLNAAFQKSGMGLVVNIEEPRSVAEGVMTIEANWDEMSQNSLTFYKSVNTKEITRQIIG